jgi:sugar/nucleoside kinase (ribokinase family)
VAPESGRLLHLGNVVVDIVLDVPALPERGGDVLATGSDTTTGGGFNVMVAAARQGLPVVYAGAHGTGPFGDRARAAMLGAGIEVPQRPKAGLDTGFVVSIVDAGGERTFLTSTGAEATLTGEDLDAIRPGPRDVVYLSGYGMLHPLNRRALMDWLPGVHDDITVVFDPGPLVHLIPADVTRSVMSRADWWSCNAREATRTTGHADPATAAAELARLTGRHGVLVRTGPDGCLVAAHDAAPVHVPGFAVHAVDTNGAGDTHTGVFVAAIATGADAIDAARTANAAAALSVTSYGPATAPTAAELARFVADQPAGIFGGRA